MLLDNNFQKDLKYDLAIVISYHGNMLCFLCESCAPVITPKCASLIANVFVLPTYCLTWWHRACSKISRPFSLPDSVRQMKNILCHLGIRTICWRQCTNTVSASFHKKLVKWHQFKVSLLMKGLLLDFQTSTSTWCAIKCQLHFYKIASSHKQICS